MYHMRMIPMMLVMNKKYQMHMKVLIFIIQKNGTIESTNKLLPLKTNFKLRMSRKMKKDLPKEKLNKNKKKTEEFLFNNLNKRNIMKLLCRMATHTWVKLTQEFMAFWKMILMLAHQTVKNIPITQSTGIKKLMNRLMLLNNKWLLMKNLRSKKNKLSKQLTLVMYMTKWTSKLDTNTILNSGTHRLRLPKIN